MSDESCHARFEIEMWRKTLYNDETIRACVCNLETEIFQRKYIILSSPIRGPNYADLMPFVKRRYA